MNLLAITLCVLMEVIIAKRLPARYNINKIAVESYGAPDTPVTPGSPGTPGTPGMIRVPLELSRLVMRNGEPHYVESFSGFPVHFPSQSNNKPLYSYSYNTDTGIQAQEEGHFNNVDTDQEVLEARGSYSYIDNESNTFQVSYVANENGFQPQGAHLPEVPPLIKKTLRYIAEHPEENGE